MCHAGAAGVDEARRKYMLRFWRLEAGTWRLDGSGVVRHRGSADANDARLEYMLRVEQRIGPRCPRCLYGGAEARLPDGQAPPP